jgi:hypothetical protein
MGVKASYGMGLPMLNKMSIQTFFTRVFCQLPASCQLSQHRLNMEVDL